MNTKHLSRHRKHSLRLGKKSYGGASGALVGVIVGGPIGGLVGALLGTAFGAAAEYHPQEPKHHVSRSTLRHSVHRVARRIRKADAHKAAHAAAVT